MHAHKLRQRQLFDDDPAPAGPVRSGEVREEALQLLTLWLYAVSKAMIEESGDDQDQR
jgi:hypothetical protein